MAGNHLLGIMHNLSKCASRLKRWSHVTFEIHKAKMQLGGLKASGEGGFPGLVIFGVIRYTLASCLTTYELKFMVNGDSVGVINPQRGLHQGDPISPYQFIIIVDVLSQQVSRAMTLGTLSGIKMARNCPLISHIFFAYDSLFFLKALYAECHTLVSILNSYCKASSQTVNFQKSSAFFSLNTPTSLRDNICGDLHNYQMEPKATYLGLPSIFGQKKAEMFGFLLDRVLQKMKEEIDIHLKYVRYAIFVHSQLSVYFLNVPGLVRFGLALPYPSDLLNLRPPTLIPPPILLHGGYLHGSSVKLNCNAAFKNSSAIFGIVACDSTWLLCYIIESDSQIDISLSSLDMSPPWSLDALVEDIHLRKKYRLNLKNDMPPRDK
nr:reverse transcriptase [Tanacetum cinerariifolium]